MLRVGEQSLYGAVKPSGVYDHEIAFCPECKGAAGRLHAGRSFATKPAGDEIAESASGTGRR